MHTHSDLPYLHATIRLKGSELIEKTEWYGIKFYPYATDPVFAVVGSRYVLICRCIHSDSASIDILHKFELDPVGSEEKDFWSVEWSQAENGDPLVCVTGDNAQINILNVNTEELATTLIGHGGAINDLSICPTDPSILASASSDHSIRIWSLDPGNAKQPTAAILYGQGHKGTVLTVAYHQKGRYLLSGGHDTKILLWRLPDNLKHHAGTDKPAMIHYPHFSTVEIHKDYVDCILWYNDLILSSAAGEGIQLWKIDNFNADHPPPNPAPIPLSTVVNSCTKVTIPTSSTSGTRSAWGGRFQRLLKFDLKESPYVYSRFGFFHELGTHPILVANSDRSKIRIWDLQHLEGLGAGVEQQPSSKIDKNSKDHLFRQVRENSAMSTASGTSAGQSATTSSTLTHGRRKATKKELEHGISTPFHAVPEQSLITIKNYKEWYRQFAWSRDGQWCVGVGTESLITVLRRWEHGVPPPETGRDGVES